jgi:hypothetical protein
MEFVRDEAKKKRQPHGGWLADQGRNGYHWIIVKKYSLSDLSRSANCIQGESERQKFIADNRG